VEGGHASLARGHFQSDALIEVLSQPRARSRKPEVGLVIEKGAGLWHGYLPAVGLPASEPIQSDEQRNHDKNRGHDNAAD
jgi:hypothetical protein